MSRIVSADEARKLLAYLDGERVCHCGTDARRHRDEEHEFVEMVDPEDATTATVTDLAATVVRLHDILDCETGKRAPEGWESVWEPEDNNGDPSEYVAIWAYRKDTICAFVGLSEDSPTTRWWSVHFGTAPSGRNQRPMERGEAENMLAAIEAAGLVIEADRTAKATANPSDG